MQLFIRIKDGLPFEHPILEDNFRQVFPDVDTENLPPEFARFERVERPGVGLWEVYEGVTYEWSGGVVKDVHRVRPMSEQEIQLKKQELDAQFYSEVDEVIAQAEIKLSQAAESNKVYWVDYIQELKKMTPVYDKAAVWPNKPIFDSNGNFVKRLTLETARV